MAPQIVVINLGPKNPTFDESIFPHLKFLYAPDLKANIKSENDINKHFTVSGEPEFLSKAFNNGKIKEYGFWLFDNKGNCYTEGDGMDIEIASTECSNGKTLGDNVKAVVKKYKTVSPSNKELDWKHSGNLKLSLKASTVVKKPFLTGHPAPDIELVDGNGNKVNLRSVVDHKPTLVTFIYLPQKGNLNAAYKWYNGPGPRPSKAVINKMSRIYLHLSMIEGQFFNFNPKKALKAKYKK